MIRIDHVISEYEKEGGLNKKFKPAINICRKKSNCDFIQKSKEKLEEVPKMEKFSEKGCMLAKFLLLLIL